MEAVWLVAVGVALLAAAFLLTPYLDWREVSGHPLEAFVSRCSFSCQPGDLVPAVARVPECRLSVVVPAYNEEHRLPQMLDEALTYLEARAASEHGFSYEVIVVDDGSKDATFAAAVASRRGGTRDDRLRVIQLASNRGKGFAVRAGVLAARGELVLMADADGATQIRDLERLEQALERHKLDGTDIVFGSRHHLKEETAVKRLPVRNFLMVAFHTIVGSLIGGPLKDTQCGFKLFRCPAAKQIFTSLHLFRWAFDVEIVLLARICGRNIVEVPVTFVDMPGSKMNVATAAATMLRDIVLCRLMYSLGFWRPAMLR